MRWLALIFITLLTYVSIASAATHTRIITHGGGPISPETAQIFVGWAGGANAKILINTYPSQSAQEEYFESISKSFIDQGVKPSNIRWAKNPPTNEAEANVFREDLKWASAVFTSGGDQTRLLDQAMIRWNLKKDLLARINSGMPYGGKSAGAESQTEIMITGRTTPASTGLGIYNQFMVRTHHWQRLREEELTKQMKLHGHTQGIGLGYGTAIAVIDGKYAYVTGSSAIFFYKVVNGVLNRTELSSGETFNLENFEPEAFSCFWNMYGLPTKLPLLLNP